MAVVDELSNQELAFELIRELDIHRLKLDVGMLVPTRIGDMNGVFDLMREWDRRKRLHMF